MQKPAAPNLPMAKVAVGRPQDKGGKHRNLAPYLLMAPTMIYMVALVIYPLLFSLFIAFRRFDPAKGLSALKMTWVGWGNFTKVMADEALWISLGNTVYIAILALVLEIVVGMGLALLLNRKRTIWPGGALTLMLTPLVLPMVAAGLIWRMLFHLDYGAVNGYMRMVGLPAIDWLGNVAWVKLAIVLVDFWQWTPFVLLILYAGLKALPEEPFEAAKVDGASALQSFWHITLPLLRWPLMVALLLRATDVWKMFDYVAALTGGGPGFSSQTLSFYVYLRGFKRFELGEAAAVSWLMLIVIYIISMLIIGALRPKRGETM
jgi:multiple sugar transport system permease protein